MNDGVPHSSHQLFREEIMKTLTLDEFALLLEYTADAKGDPTASVVARDLREEDDSIGKLAALNSLGRALGVIS